MTASKIWRLGSTAGLLAVLGSGCGSDDHSADGDDGSQDDGSQDGSDGSPDGSDGSADGSDGSPDGSGDGSGGDGSNDGCGDGAIECAGTTPVCVDNECVECSADDATACEVDEICDASRNTCVNKLTPFSLNCADLPSDGACQGGPREVLLAIQDSGYIGMFDPEDGTFLGPYKRITVPSKVNLDRMGEERTGEYVYATQGPDQCIWAVGDDERGVERWDTDGSFKDNIIPYDRYYEGQDELVDDVHHVAFTQDSVYVASTSGSPNPRLVRFDLDALDPDAAAPNDRYEVVLDDGSEVESLVVLGDGSLVVANGDTYRIEYLPADGSGAQPLLADLWPYQVTYAGAGEVLAFDHAIAGAAYRVGVANGVVSAEMTPFEGGFNIYGIAPLENGKWLITGGDGAVSSFDPSNTPDVPPPGQFESVWNDPASGGLNFKMIGRACLSDEFIASRAVDAPVASCDEPAGEAILREDFETGDFTGTNEQRNFAGFYERPASGVTVSIDDALGAGTSTRSLKVDGGLELSVASNPSGVTRAIPAGTQPSYIGYYVRLDELATGGYFAMNPPAEGELDAVLFLASGYLTTWNLNGSDAEVTRDEWIRVQLRDFDWDLRTYDLYVNCERVADDISFGIYGGDDLHAIELFNYEAAAVSWFDEIVIK